MSSINLENVLIIINSEILPKFIEQIKLEEAILAALTSTPDRKDAHATK